MHANTESHRPSERTELFLRDYLSQSHHLPGDRLPSPRRIAAELKVSESTVRGVVRRWLQEGKLRSRQGSGIFICKPGREARPLRIGANVVNQRQQNLLGWSGTIHIHALEAVMELGPKGSFTSLYSATEEPDSLPDKEVVARCRDLDGIILYQSSFHVPAIADYCKRHGKPFVYLNPPTDDSVANFVALETFTAFYRITRALRDCGRKRFALLIHPQLERSVSTRQRLSGVANGIGEALGLSAELRVVHCEGHQEEDGRRHTEKLLKRDCYRPDAILCAGDLLAFGALQALKEADLSTPGDVSVVSGAGFDPRIGDRQVTTLVQPLEGIARNLVSMLLEMIERQATELPAQILPIGLRLGKTTTRQENSTVAALFGKDTRP